MAFVQTDATTTINPFTTQDEYLIPSWQLYLRIEILLQRNLIKAYEKFNPVQIAEPIYLKIDAIYILIKQVIEIKWKASIFIYTIAESSDSQWKGHQTEYNFDPHGVTIF